MVFVDLREDLPWLRGDRVHVVPAEREGELLEALQRRAFLVHALEGSRMRDEASFFAEATRALHLPDYFGHNWDAWNDSLGELVAEGAGGIAIVWRDASHLLAADPQTLLDAVLALEAVARWAPPDEVDPAQLEVFLVGLGAA